MGMHRCLSILVASALPFCPGAGLRGACENIDDPFQVLDFHLRMGPADWETVREDESFSVEKPAFFSCGDESPIPCNVRRKRSIFWGPGPASKVSLKIDFDDQVSDLEWKGHRKLSLESGGRYFEELSVLLREGIAWWLMSHAGMVTGQAAWVRLHVNGEAVGVYTRVEQVDKAFLRRRLWNDEGFLWKGDPTVHPPKSQVTRQGESDPTAAALCFEPFEIEGFACPMPAGALESLADRVDIHQLLTLGAVNTILCNLDAPFWAYWNCYWYDSDRPRVYVPWDLDYVMLPPFVEADPHAIEERNSRYASILLAVPALRREYDEILLRIVHEVCSPELIDRLLDALEPRVGSAIDQDPTSGIPGGFSAERRRIQSWFEGRAAVMERALPAYRPFPIVINEILARNESSDLDERGEREGWLEIHNRGPSPYSLDGLYLSDDPARPLLWPLPDVVLPPGGFLRIWCDAESRDGQYHAAFVLDAGGEAAGIYARRPGGGHVVRDFIRYEPQEADVALARLPDGAPGFWKVPCPTPGAANEGDCPSGVRFVRGDANDDGKVNVSDAVRILGSQFLGHPIDCRAAHDANDDGDTDLSDAISVLEFLFRRGPRPPLPFPDCGGDPSPDGLGCARHRTCG